MSKTREALEAVKAFFMEVDSEYPTSLFDTVEAALAEPEQEPVCIVQTHGNWYYSKHDDENACGYCHVREQFKSSKPCKPRLEPAPQPREWKELTQPSLFKFGEIVEKTSGSQWSGRIVGRYSTSLTPDGYAVESDSHAGSVQIYPAKALRAKNGG